MTELDARLRAADPVPDPAAVAVDDRRLADGLAAIVALAPPTRWTRLRSRTAALVAALVAVFAVGTGIAFAAGVPQQVLRVFAGEPASPGQPVPWNAHDIRLAATLPLDRGRHLQIWTAVNDLNDGPCTDYQVVSATGHARDRGHSCEGSYPSGTTPGATPTPDPDVFFVYPAMNLFPFQPDNAVDPEVYVGRFYDPAATGAVLSLAGHPDRPFTVDGTGRWGIVELPAGTGDPGPGRDAGHVLVRDAHGRVVSTVDLATLTARPDTNYKADGTVAPPLR